MTKIKLSRDAENIISKAGKKFISIKGSQSFKDSDDKLKYKNFSLALWQNIDIAKLKKGSKIEFNKEFKNEPWTGSDGITRDCFCTMIFKDDLFVIIESAVAEEPVDTTAKGGFVDKVIDDDFDCIPF